VTTDLDHKFELAVDLRHMAIAHAVLVEATSKAEGLDLESTEMQGKWRRLGECHLCFVFVFVFVFVFAMVLFVVR